MRVLVASVLLLTVSQADAQTMTHGRVIGRVVEHEDKNKPVAAATVLLPDGKSFVTDASGRFTIPELLPGNYKLTFEMLGYGKREHEVVVVETRTTEVNVELSRKPIELPPISVTVRSRWLELQGFYDRQVDHRGRLTSFTATDIEKANPTFITDLLRRAPGASIHHGSAGGVGNRVLRFNREAVEGLMNATNRRKKIPGCEPTLYVDGAKYEDPSGESKVRDWNFIAPINIEAIEVYHSLNQPIQYKDPCGVVLIWLKRG